jgi:nitrogen fixation/metabolism regulation signal transduction histidine kinase
MNIRQKIIGSFILVIFLLLLSLGSVLIFHISSINDYKKISNTLTLEERLTNDTSELMEAFNAVAVAPTNESRIATYTAKRDSILSTFKELDADITDSDSVVAYQGLKNIILSILQDLESGRAALSNGDIVGSSQYYSDAVSKKAFVEANVTELLVKELEHLNNIKTQIEEKYKEQLLTVLLWLVATVFLSLLYALFFGRMITSPIEVLSVAAKKVKEGNYSFQISEDLLRRSDEVGNLANSFSLMLEALNNKIEQVEMGNAVILETKRHLEERNKDLEKFNHMVIKRELRMVELKNKIASLEEELREMRSRQ